MFFPRMNTMRRNTTMGNPMALFNRVMGTTLDNLVTGTRLAAPAFNLWADDNGAVLTSEMPGVAQGDLEITVSGKQVTVASSRKEEAEEGQRCVRRERSQGSFQRRFELPFAVDGERVEAKLTNGVLEVVLPRAESDKPRKIEVRAN